MAYEPRYEAFFRDNTPDKRRYRTRWLDRDFPGGVVDELFFVGTPLEYEAKSSDDPFTPIWGTVLTISVLASPVIELTTFYTEDDRKWRVITERITEDGTPIETVFFGYLTPFGTTKEEYKKGTYKISMTAMCGLGTLKDYPFYASPIQPYPRAEPLTALIILRTCLLFLDYTLPIAISINCVEVSMMPGLATRPGAPYSVLANYAIDTARFLTDTGIESCYNVLTAMLESMNACIVQDRGKWVIMRLDEYASHTANNGIVPFIYYSSFYLDNTIYGEEVSMMHLVNHERTGEPLAGGELSVEPSKKKMTLKYEYGKLKNELKNGNFGSKLQYWKSHSNNQQLTEGASNIFSAGDGSEDSPSAIRIFGTTNNFQQRNDTVGAQQTIRYPARSGNSDAFSLSLTFRNYRTGHAKIAVLASVDGKGPYLLQEDGTWAEAPDKKTSRYIFKNNTYKDTDGLDRHRAADGKIEIETSPVPGKGAYDIVVVLYRGVNLPAFTDQYTGATDPTAYVEYRNLILTKMDLSLRNLEGENLKGEAPGFDRKREGDVITLRLGDQTSAKVTRNILLNTLPPTTQQVTAYYPRYGALLRLDGVTPTEKWLPYQSDPAQTANYKKLQQLCLQGRLTLTGKAGRVFDGDLRVKDPAAHIGPMDILHFEELGFYARIVGGYKWDIKRNVFTVRALKISEAGPITIKNYWETPDGAEPMDETGTVPPAKSNRPAFGVNLTPGQINEVINRKQTGVATGFAFDPTEGYPIRPGKGLAVIGNRLTEVLIRMVK